MSGAKKYVVYANACGRKNKLKKLKTTTAKAYTLKKIGGKKLKKGTYYKFMVAALDANNKVISVSKVIHVATKGGKVGNSKNVTTKLKNSKATIKKGKSRKLGAKAIPVSKKLKVKKHRVIKYESTNPAVAVVTSKGTVKAKGKGICYVYAYAQNGVFKRVKVKVT